MNRRDLLKLTLTLGLANHALAAHNRYDEVRHPPMFYTFGAEENITPGIHRMQLDDRTIEITLPEREPSWVVLPEKVTSKGEDEAFLKMLRNKKKNQLTLLYVDWKYGFSDGVLLGRSSGGLEATLDVREHTEIWVKAPGVTTTLGKYTFKDKKLIELDYFKLDDFILAVHGDANPEPYWVEVINGRQWVRTIHWVRQPLRDMPPSYQEYFYTPLDQRRILKLRAGLYYSFNYDIPEGMPRWMQRLSRNITDVLCSLKISPPDDGSPDPFLIDPEMKAEATPVVFPARWR